MEINGIPGWCGEKDKFIEINEKIYFCQQVLEPNLSLLLKKYVLWKNEENKKTNKKETKIDKESLTRVAVKVSSKIQYRDIYLRYFDCIDADMRHTLKTATRLIVGLGGESVTETSIKLHPLYGFPIIPGSAVKGVLRNYCGSDSKHKELEKIIFGQEPESSPLQEGAICFLDAWPESNQNRELLETDVMTPHYTKYYGSNSEYPKDNDNPNPILFLVVRKGVRFTFGWRKSSTYNFHREEMRKILGLTLKAENDAIDNKVNENIRNLLKEALTIHGIGAKTGSDYGYFEKEG